MKKIILFLLVTFFVCNTDAQNDWAPLDHGTDGTVYDLIVYNNELYAAGQFSVVGGMVRPNIAKWNGTTWSTVGGTNSILNGGVSKMIIYNNDLYIMGKFYAAGTSTVGHVAKWNGSTWVSVGFPNPIPNYDIGAAVVFNNELYVMTRYLNGPEYLYKYNGTSWSTLGTTNQGSGFALCVYNNELYASRNFTTSLPLPPGNNSGISKWNGTTWIDVGGLVVSPPIDVFAMTVHNNELYVGGDFNTVGGISATDIAKYNGSSWSVVNTGVPSANAFYSLLSYNGNLYAGGCLFNNGGACPVNNVNVLNGSIFTTVAPNECLDLPSCQGVFDLCIFNNVLHVGGSFGADLLKKNVARLVSGVGIKEENLYNAYLLYPNPSTGKFTFEGITENFYIEVTDLTGRVIYTGELDESNNSINLQRMHSGLYLYKLRNKQNQVQQGKLVLE